MSNSKIKTGMSASASWAWGTSLIMGQQIAQQKGLTAWIIWAVCNTLTLALFGYLYKHGHIRKEVCMKKGFKEIALLIQVFCLLVQLNFINQQVFILTGNEVAAYCASAVVGSLFVMIVFNKGLPTSIFTDVFQWMIAIGAILIIISMAAFTRADRMVFADTTASGIKWGIWSGIVLFSGPIGDVQHWQRAEYDKSQTAYYYGAVFFGMYMLLILGMAFFKFNAIMNMILLVAVLCVTTSTIDSIAVAMHEIHDKKVGTAVALLVCVGWGLLAKIGMINLWSSFGIIRFAFAAAILIYPLKSKLAKELLYLLTVGVMVYFAVAGQVSINTIYGQVCFAVAILVVICGMTAAVREEKVV